MGRQHLPVTKSAMMSAVLFLLPILLCVAQVDSKYFLINTVDDEESGGRANDYQFNQDLLMALLQQLKQNGGSQCGSVICQTSNHNADYQELQIGTNTVSGCCANNM